MPITLSFGNDDANDIQLTNLIDLATPSTTNPTVFKFAASLVPDLGQDIANFPAASSPITLNYQSGNGSWTLGNFTFGLSGGVSGQISVIQPDQTLLSYTESFPTTIGTGLNTATNSSSTGKLVGTPGQYYVQVTLNVQLSASASAKVNIGQVGVQGNVGTTSKYQVTFSKAVPPGTMLGDALGQAFSAFVLPLHPNTFQHLQAGDFLYHNFNATLNIGFGVTLGLNEVYFAGQYLAAIPRSPAGTPSVTFKAQVGLQANASFGTTFQYSGSFETMLSKTADGNGHLHLYRSQTTDLGFTAGLTVAVIANPSVSIAAPSFAKLAQAALPGSSAAVQQLLTDNAAQTQVNNWANEAQQKITSWLKPVQEAKAQLEITFDNLNSRFLLIDATCDTSQIGFPTAWKNIVAGDFQAALAQTKSGITLDAGSGLEEFHHSKTDITLNLFGAFNAEWTTADVKNLSIVYAGNNTFQLIENIGLQSITNINGSGREIDLFFAAQATASVAGGLTLDAVELHVIVKATNNAKCGEEIAQLLSLASAGTAAGSLYNQLQASAKRPNTTQIVELIFEPAAYQKLQFSAGGQNGGLLQPARNDDGADSGNYATFANASWQSQPGAVANVSDFSVSNKLDLTYEVWAAFNIIANGGDPNAPNAYPDRRHSGNPAAAMSFLDGQFNSPVTLNLIPYVLSQATAFMNFCEDLAQLTTLVGSTNANWNNLCADLGSIIHNDVPSDYLLPAGYALTELLVNNGVEPSIMGPTADASGEDTISITLHYAS